MTAVNDDTPNALSLAFVEGLYAEYLRDPTSVDASWRAYFDEQPRTADRLGPSFRAHSVFAPAGSTNGRANGAAADLTALQDRVDQLVRAYRVRGHLLAQLDPLGLPRPPQRELEPSYYGLGDEHLDIRFSGSTVAGLSQPTLREILDRLQTTYCRSIGVQFMHIDELRSEAIGCKSGWKSTEQPSAS